SPHSLPHSRLCLLRLFLTHTAPTPISTLSLHDALPISRLPRRALHADPVRGNLQIGDRAQGKPRGALAVGLPRSRSLLGSQEPRSEEHTSELQSRENLVCRLLLEKKKKNIV